MVILLMFLYSDQCGGFCVCNIMSRMSGHVYPQSFMILNVFTIMFDLVHMQSQSFQMIFQSLMTSYQSVILFFSAQVTGFHLEMGLLFRVILLFNRGEPLSKFFLKCVFWLPLSNEGSHRCSGVFVFEIIAFKVFNFLSSFKNSVSLFGDLTSLHVYSRKCCQIAAMQKKKKTNRRYLVWPSNKKNRNLLRLCRAK